MIDVLNNQNDLPRPDHAALAAAGRRPAPAAPLGPGPASDARPGGRTAPDHRRTARLHRGLAIHGTLAFVGLSKVRASSSLEGVPIAARIEQLKCGCAAVVDLLTGQAVAYFYFVSGIDELFDVQIPPGISSPFLSGPFADKGLGSSLWSLPPSR